MKVIMLTVLLSVSGLSYGRSCEEPAKISLIEKTSIVETICSGIGMFPGGYKAMPCYQAGLKAITRYSTSESVALNTCKLIKNFWRSREDGDNSPGALSNDCYRAAAQYLSNFNYNEAIKVCKNVPVTDYFKETWAVMECLEKAFDLN